MPSGSCVRPGTGNDRVEHLSSGHLPLASFEVTAEAEAPGMRTGKEVSPTEGIVIVARRFPPKSRNPQESHKGSKL